MVQQINQQLAGNHIILLHDGGGNRDRTIEALPLIIKDLRQRGIGLLRCHN